MKPHITINIRRPPGLPATVVVTHCDEAGKETELVCNSADVKLEFDGKDPPAVVKMIMGSA